LLASLAAVLGAVLSVIANWPRFYRWLHGQMPRWFNRGPVVATLRVDSGICVGDTVWLRCDATDPDSDAVVYDIWRLSSSESPRDSGNGKAWFIPTNPGDITATLAFADVHGSRAAKSVQIAVRPKADQTVEETADVAIPHPSTWRFGEALRVRYVGNYSGPDLRSTPDARAVMLEVRTPGAAPDQSASSAGGCVILTPDADSMVVALEKDAAFRFWRGDSQYVLRHLRWKMGLPDSLIVGPDAGTGDTIWVALRKTYTAAPSY
jgi:hypothetical protein